MPGGPKKVPTTCPHCGHSQLEPKGLISTYCRGCGGHYSVTSARTSTPAASAPSVIRRLVPRLRKKACCRECGHEHGLALELTATSCPGCGAAMNLADVEVSRHSTQAISTYGTVHIAKGAYLNSTHIECGSLFSEGRVAGKITCAGSVRLRGHGICRTQITARNLIVDRGAQLRIPYTIHVENAYIRGIVEADLVCYGVLHIGRNGGLDGDVQARAMSVDKGAFFLGSVEVSARKPEPQAPRADSAPPRLLPLWNRGLAFGVS